MFRKLESDVSYFDFIHLRPSLLIDHEPAHKVKLGRRTYFWDNDLPDSKNDVSSNSSDSENLYEDQAPLIGYIKSTSPCILTTYSLKNETAVDIQRFGSPILKFSTPLKNEFNKMTVLLQEGMIKVYDLRTMTVE